MNIGKIFSNSGKWILNRCFGTMTERQISASTLKVGRKLVDTARKGETLTENVVESIFASSVPKGIKTPQMLSDIESLTNFVMQKSSPLLPPQEAKELLSASKNIAGAITLKFRNNSAIYLPKEIAEFPEKAINFSTHEFRHFLDYGNKILGKILTKILPAKVLKQCALKSVKYHKNYFNMQSALISDLELICTERGLISGNITGKLKKSNKEIVRFLRKRLRNESSEYSLRERFAFLKVMETYTKSEAKAYSQGGRAARMFSAIGKPVENPSEIIGFYQSQLLEAIKREQALLKRVSNKGIRGFSFPKHQLVVRPKALKNIGDEINSQQISRVTICDELVALSEV